MTAIKVAVAYEGPAEKEVVVVLLERLFGKTEFEIVDAKSPRTGLIGYLASYIESFSATGADLYIFFTDEDSSPEREKKIKETISSIPAEESKVVVGLSVPHFESWLLGDHDTVKKVFGLDGSEPLPYQGQNPKKQLELLQKNMPEGSQITLFDARTKLAESMDFKKVSSRCADFSKFCDDFSEKVKGLAS